MTDIEKAVRAAFIAGWDAGWDESGEGHNGEYCRAKDGHLVKVQQEDLAAYLAEAAEDNARAIDPPAFTGTAAEFGEWIEGLVRLARAAK